MLLFSRAGCSRAGDFLSLLGIILGGALSVQNLAVGGINLNVGTLMMACMAVVVGFQLIAFAFFTKVFAIAEGFCPTTRNFPGFSNGSIGKASCSASGSLLAGILLSVRAVWIWQQAGFGQLSPEENLRRLIPAATLIVLGVQAVFSSFFMSALD